MADPLQTVMVERLGCRVPIIQTAMGWVAEPPLVIAASESGAFGFLGAAVMTPDEVGQKLLIIRRATDKPFGVNFHFFQPGAEKIVELIIANKKQIRAVSFGRGPDVKMIARFKEAGILCVPTVGAVKHAVAMQKLGVDMVNVQGGEGGGHTGSVPTTILLPQILDAVNIPVIASGGFADGRGLVAALAFGAVGIAMGTRFLLTKESPVPDNVKSAYLQATTNDIFVTTRLDGMPQRMIRTKHLANIEHAGRLDLWLRALSAGDELRRQNGQSWLQMFKTLKRMVGHGAMPLRQAMMAATTPLMIQKAMLHGDLEHGVMATGMVGGRLMDLPTCQSLVEQIMQDARTRLTALTG